MEKDKNKLPKTVSNILQMLQNSVEKIIAKVNSLDPRDNTRQRVITALVLIPIALYAILYSKDVFVFLAIGIAILMSAEWLDIIRNAMGKEQQKWRIIGFFVILIPIYSVIKIRLYDADILLWMFAVIWSTDIFAFFAGRILGGAKLAPSISPNKTWSGLAGGVLASMIIGLMSSFMFSGGVLFFTFVSGILALIEQASDLLESKFKRIFGVKDSGTIIPGHGGILDRLDGMLLVAPVVLFLITAFPSKFGG